MAFLFKSKRKRLSGGIENGCLSPQALSIREWFASRQTLEVGMLTLGATLGTGTFGRVRLATTTINGCSQCMALKMLKKSEIIRLKQIEHIKDEKKILDSICHPFIVNFYSSFQDKTHVYMVMEYVVGGELFSQLRRARRFSNDTSRFYAAEIILAIEFLHDRNIIYRDLKPENILIDRDGHVKLTDFGFAKYVEDRTWTLCGTPEYLAPEIIQSKGHGKAVDWWALGVLIFEMCAGYPPFFDENPFGIYQKILDGSVDFPKHFDPNAKDLVRRLLTSDLTKRYGCLNAGADDIKTHKWFKGIDWDEALQRKLAPPYIPMTKSDTDTSSFDKYPDSLPNQRPQELSPSDATLFDSF